MRVIVCLVTTFGAVAAVVATTANAGSGSSCQTNPTFQQAALNGALPAVYAAVHGVALPNASLDCVVPRR